MLEAKRRILDRGHAFQPLPKMMSKVKEAKKPFLEDVPREIVSQGHNNKSTRFGGPSFSRGEMLIYDKSKHFVSKTRERHAPGVPTIIFIKN